MRKLIIIILFLYSINAFPQSGWVLQNVGNNYLYGVHFFNYNTGYIVPCYGNIIYKTTNSGINWISNNIGLGTSSLDSYFFDTNNIVIVGTYYDNYGYFHGIIKITHDGVNWSIVSLNPNLDVLELCATDWLNINTGYVIGTDYNMSNYYGRVFKTTNGGLNWFEQSLPSAGYYDVKFKNQDTAYALDNIALVRTTNKGVNWIEYSYPGGRPNIFSFPSFDTVFIGGLWGEIRRSINGGLNWTLMHTDSGKSVRDVFFINAKTGWFTGDSGMIKRTTNAGLIWQVQNSNTKNVLRKIYFLDENTGWIVGDSGIVLKTTTGGTTFINNLGNELPNNFRLYQNYPNPFNPVTKIKFDVTQHTPYPHLLGGSSISRGEMISIRVFDIIGREVATLINEQLSPGTYSIDWNASAFPSGVYFYKLESGNYTETKQMVLIK